MKVSVCWKLEPELLTMNHTYHCISFKCIFNLTFRQN